jgi:hypothetical protein
MLHILRRSVGSPCPLSCCGELTVSKSFADLHTLEKCPRNLLTCGWRMVAASGHSSDEVTSQILSNSSTMLLYLKRSYGSCIIHAYRMCCTAKNKGRTIEAYCQTLSHRQTNSRSQRPQGRHGSWHTVSKPIQDGRHSSKSHRGIRDFR